MEGQSNRSMYPTCTQLDGISQRMQASYKLEAILASHNKMPGNSIQFRRSRRRCLSFLPASLSAAAMDAVLELTLAQHPHLRIRAKERLGKRRRPAQCCKAHC
jgi:hypothetical protein